MKKIKYSILIIVGLLYMCSYNVITHMGAKDISLLSLYAPNDTVIFMNTITKETDTMFVVDKQIYNSLWPFIRSEATNEYYAGGYIEFLIKHKDASIRGKFIITKTEQGEPVKQSFVFGNRFCINEYSLSQKDYTIFKKMGREIKECTLINSKNSILGKLEEPDSVEQFVWSKELGLLYYQYMNGAEYYLYKK